MPNPPSRRAARQQLESLERAGVTHVPRPQKRKQTPAAANALATPSKSVPAKPIAAKAAPPSSGAALPPALEVIRQEVAACVCCAPLAAARTQTVFGVGNPQARLCFFGEAPGADEDRRGEPFVGRAGQLLTRIIEACGLKRSDVYILNVLKCRPPENRTPEPDEVANCRGYFERQFAAIRPEFICCLGKVAASALLRNDEPIGRLRGRWFDYEGARVMCTYHPSYLLRNPEAKKWTWDDMKMLLAEMGLPIP